MLNENRLIIHEHAHHCNTTPSPRPSVYETIERMGLVLDSGGGLQNQQHISTELCVVSPKTRVAGAAALGNRHVGLGSRHVRPGTCRPFHHIIFCDGGDFPHVCTQIDVDHGRPQEFFQRGAKPRELTKMANLAARTKLFAIFRRFRLNLNVVVASAEGASENFMVFCTGTAYDVIIFKFPPGAYDVDLYNTLPSSSY